MRILSRLFFALILFLLPACGGVFSVPEDIRDLPKECITNGRACDAVGCPGVCTNDCPLLCAEGGGDGRQGDGRQGDGRQGDGRQGDGRQGDGRQGDGRQGDGRQGDGQQGDGQQGDGQQGRPCGSEICVGDEECVDFGLVSTCLAPCAGTSRCGPGLSCCPAERSECVNGTSCQAPCPVATDTRCGATGEICCSAGTVCGASDTCVQDCGDALALCGDGTPASFGSTCCTTGQVCVFDECRTPGTEPCTSFSDCAPGEYCEYVLDPSGCGADCATIGLCLPDDAPPDTLACQGRPSDLFEPVFEWHWRGVREGTCANGEACSGLACTTFNSNSCYRHSLTTPLVADMDKVWEAPLEWQSPITGDTVTFPAGYYPEVVFKPYSNALGDSRIVILDGRTGETKKIIAGDRGFSHGQPVIVNIDDDPVLEIVNPESMGIRAFDPFYVSGQGYDANWGATNTAGNLNQSGEGRGITATDLNGDGRTELLVAGVVVDGKTGQVLVDMGNLESNPGEWANWDISIVADIDLDGVPEVVVGNRAFEVSVKGSCGTCPDVANNPQHCEETAANSGVYACVAGAGQPHVWTWAANPGAGTNGEWNASDIGAGNPGVGNFIDNTIAPWNADLPSGADPGVDYPEVVVVHSGQIAILNGFDGSLMYGPNNGGNSRLPLKFDLFNTRGGTPNIADFDGDGRVEVSMAGTGCMVVIDVDCAVSTARRATAPAGCGVDPVTISRCTASMANSDAVNNLVGVLWMDETQDVSSAATGTSVFDFQGDGKAEVLYNDECFFRVYDGETGGVLMERPNSSRTGNEYPIVVDADGDGNSEILVSANNDQSGPSRDCCNGPSGDICDENVPSKGTNMVYWRNADLYTPAFCTCGHLLSQTACNKRSGCAWRNDTAVCELDACSGRNETSCTGITGCDWQTSACVQSDCTAFAKDTCLAAPYCRWNFSTNACAYRPERNDDPDDICVDGTTGVWSLGDTEGRWVQTLPYWHQHAYHVTEIDGDGNPVSDWGPGKNNWDIYNNLRQNVQGYAPLNAPDLQVYAITANLLACPSIRLNARIVNRGRAGIAAGVPIVFYYRVGTNPPVELQRINTPYALLPGLGVDIALNVAQAQLPSGPYDFIVVANPQGPDDEPVPECLTDNNQATVTDVQCDFGG